MALEVVHRHESAGICSGVEFMVTVSAAALPACVRRLRKVQVHAGRTASLGETDQGDRRHRVLETRDRRRCPRLSVHMAPTAAGRWEVR